MKQIEQAWYSQEVLDLVESEEPDLLLTLLEYVDALRAVQLDFTVILEEILETLPTGLALYAKVRAGGDTNELVFSKGAEDAPKTVPQGSYQDLLDRCEIRKRKRGDSDPGEGRVRSDASGSGPSCSGA